MINIFDIAELKYIIIGYLDLKSICRMMRLNQFTKCFIEDMPIGRELHTCLYNIRANSSADTIIELLFLRARENNYLNLIRNIHTYYWHKISDSFLDLGLFSACGANNITVIKYLLKHGINIHTCDDLAL